MDVDQQGVGQQVPQDLDVFVDGKVEDDHRCGLCVDLRLLVVHAPCVQTGLPKDAGETSAPRANLDAERPERNQVEALALKSPQRWGT